MVHYISQKMYDILTDDIIKCLSFSEIFYFNSIENRVISLCQNTEYLCA
jgi:hypothetical protein